VPGSTDFTKAVCILLHKPAEVVNLSANQVKVLKPFRKFDEIVIIDGFNRSPVKAGDDIVAQLEKKSRMHDREMESIRRYDSNVNYSGLKAVIPTSNICETLFSKAGIVFNKLRRSMSPVTLEMLLFLHANYELWSEGTVDVAIRRSNEAVKISVE
jgi:hypothetical protein